MRFREIPTLRVVREIPRMRVVRVIPTRTRARRRVEVRFIVSAMPVVYSFS